MNNLLGTSADSPLPTAYSKNELPSVFSTYFHDKIQALRDTLETLPSKPPPPDSPFTGTPLSSFRPVSQEEVLKTIKSMSLKTCELDPLPASLYSEGLPHLLPFITDIINTSIQTGSVPDSFKTAIVRPLLKKHNLDPNDLKNYRPVSNLSFLSKLLEKVVLNQLNLHLSSNNLLLPFQSAYRQHHSTETALLHILNDLLLSTDSGKISLLTLLDFSAAFDTIDGICGRVLRCCADQLGSVFTHLFQISLDSGHIPALWKFSDIVPLPKKTNPKQPNDFRPVALTSVVMKTLEKIVKSLVLTATQEFLDPLQFAYRAGRGVDDAKLFILNSLYKHLEKPKAHARILFADFSSAFNTVQPHILVRKLLYDFNVAHQLVQWILDFLTNRQQRVIVNGLYSDVRFTNTGSPQGCCLSPFLYILYTDSCRCSREGSHLVKFSDDAALLTLLQGGGEQSWGFTVRFCGLV